MKKPAIWIPFIFAALTLAVINIFIAWSNIWPREVKPDIRVSPVKASQTAINTNKKIYKKGELVRITFLNQADGATAEQSELTINTKIRGNMGRNFGAGLIEQYLDGAWLAIEPVWRCDEACYLPCSPDRFILSGESRFFIWPQVKVECFDPEKQEKMSQVASGRFRVFSMAWDEELSINKKLYSNEFIIK